MRKIFNTRNGLLTGLCVGLAALIAACSSPPKPVAVVAPVAPPVAPRAPEPAPTAVATAPATAPATKKSAAKTAREYRLDAAGHLYALNPQRIFQGKMPPLLYAIGVLEVDVDARGHVISTHWMRAPSHAPEVVAEIERTVRQAAPYPVPARLGRVTYTDTWLWHKSGKFQLDTLTEGQL
jgi:hypothetical protein